MKSMLAAAVPVTLTSTDVPAIAAGMTSLRNVVTSVLVASSWGAVVGNTVMRKASGDTGRLGNAGVTAAMPGVSPSAPWSVATAAASSASVGTTVIISGPLKPAPNPSARRS